MGGSACAPGAKGGDSSTLGSDACGHKCGIVKYDRSQTISSTSDMNRPTRKDFHDPPPRGFLPVDAREC
eukprot:5748376-Prymnesium_polylepis.1